jgi:hypothetical protein
MALGFTGIRAHVRQIEASMGPIPLKRMAKVRLMRLLIVIKPVNMGLD